MVPSSVIRRECIPSYVGDVKHPMTPLAFDRTLFFGSQSVVSAVLVSCNIPVINLPIPVVSVSSPELVVILKCVSSNPEIVRSNAASPVEVASDSSGCSLKVENKCVKHKIAHRCSDKDITVPFSANEGVTVETVDKSVKFRLNKSKEKSKKDDSDESDSFEAESVTIKSKSKRMQKKRLYPGKYDGTTPLLLFLTNVESCAA